MRVEVFNKLRNVKDLCIILENELTNLFNKFLFLSLADCPQLFGVVPMCLLNALNTLLYLSVIEILKTDSKFILT